MKPDKRFMELPMSFWANVKTISEVAGYKIRKRESIVIPDKNSIKKAFNRIGLSYHSLINEHDKYTALGEKTIEYFEYRAEILTNQTQYKFMDKEKAANTFEKLRAELNPTVPMPMNKQSKDFKKVNYFTALINMIIEKNIENYPVDYDPRKLTKFSKSTQLVRTFSRRVDGAFPSVINPIAIWEIKEYYNTTTFGSRVSDGVYETLMDGMEIKEMESSESIDVEHYMMIDDHYTWWDKGASYLCRLFDMMHMGYVDEVLCGTEVIDRLPVIVKGWNEKYKIRSEQSL